MINLANLGPQMLKLAQVASTPPAGGAPSPFGMPQGGLAGILGGKSDPKGLLGMLNNGMQPQGNPFPTPIGAQDTGSNANPFPVPTGSPFPKPMAPRRDYAPAPRPRPPMAQGMADATGGIPGAMPAGPPPGVDPISGIPTGIPGAMPAGPMAGVDPAMGVMPPMKPGMPPMAGPRRPISPTMPMFGSLAPGGGMMMPPNIPL